MIGLLLLAGCGGGNGSGVSLQRGTFGPLTTQFVGTPQQPVTGSGAGSDVAGVAGAQFSNASLKANPQEVLIGQTGKLGAKAAGLFYVTQGASVTSVAAVDAFNPDEVRITSEPSGSDPSVLLFNVTAPHGVSSFTYVNSLSGATNTLIRNSEPNPSVAVSFQVIINVANGTVKGIDAIHLMSGTTP
jgi:hypothetical protein